MQKRLFILLLDALFLPMLLWASLSLGKNEVMFPHAGEWWIFPLALAISFPVFINFGLYRAVLRYFRNQTISAILLSTLITTIIWAITVKVTGMADLTKSGVILYWLSTFTFIAGSRLQIQQWLYGTNNDNKTSRKRVYIYGAGESGTKLAALLDGDPAYVVEGFIDDNASLRGWNMLGFDVQSYDKTAATLMNAPENTEVIIAMPSIDREERQFIIERLEPFPVKVRIIPAIEDFASGNFRVSDIKDIDIDDLLGREPVSPDKQLLPANIHGKTVLISGAGGSIGSELCRQALNLRPKKLVLLELSEFALYKIEQELNEILSSVHFSVEIERVLGSSGDITLLDKLFSRNEIQTVYHAAAYKHVPLVEENSVAGIKNNVFGTKTLAEKSLASKVETFILISTDKAVRPTNVMGCTKRIAEMVLQSLANSKNCETTFSMVRFGNVLGSSGSVVPKFRQQIADGGPITVTHKEITRYFMSIPEAVQLVIQAGAMAKGGDVFVLDMGESVKITDLATKMISLAGLQLKDQYNPDGDIEVKYSGLRPGEKLYEELLIGDNVSGTKHSRIMQANEEFLSKSQLEVLLKNLQNTLTDDNLDEIKKSLTKIVSGYTPWENTANNDSAISNDDKGKVIPIKKSYPV
ncbi:nucleoside-diphosphate sugar epimerase/dehydratase [uncultured Cocleimonas sp.]|uniref:polysaccharide biosynthesis protein n=1 Tax=uncultured Cocleimonas sp. TaxID=1051587 RepID=UPI00262E8A7E|nr:nucleoside-diphosphate sugar epimerase/dehydratase [uncultured Cocleimonas sp.]